MSNKAFLLSIIGILIVVSGVVVFKVQQLKEEDIRSIPDDRPLGTTPTDEEVLQVFIDNEETLNEISEELIEIENSKEIFIDMIGESGPEFLRPGEEVPPLQENDSFVENLEKIYATYEIQKITKRMYGNFISFSIMNTPRGYRMQFVYNPENVTLGHGVEPINDEWDFWKILNE